MNDKLRFSQPKTATTADLGRRCKDGGAAARCKVTCQRQMGL
jgi:hypothetical protein